MNADTLKRGWVEGPFGRRKSGENNKGSIKKWNLDSTRLYPQLEEKITAKQRLLQQQNVEKKHTSRAL